MKIQYVVIVIVLVVVLGSGYFLLNKPSSPPVEVPVPNVTYSMTDVAAHAAKADCWQAINGVVYDFTPYLASATHPGGAAMAKDCGTDASFTYENDPPHSEYARSLLPQYAIGRLE